MREKRMLGFCPQRGLIVTAMYRKFQPKLMLFSEIKRVLKNSTYSENSVSFLRIRHLRKKASILAETFGTLQLL